MMIGLSNSSSHTMPYSCNLMFNGNSNFYENSNAAMSSSSNPDSPDSTMSMASSPAMSVTLSPESMENLLGMSAEEQAQHGVDTSQSQPSLVIREQPFDKYRFRYKSEMMGSHGCMAGRSSDKRRKYYPSVELLGYKAAAVIRCSLYTANKDESLRTFHCHRLVIKVGKDDLDDPHQIAVGPDAGFIAVFKGMGIIHTAKKNIAEELHKKLRFRALEKLMAINCNATKLSQNDEVKIRADAHQTAKTMDLNVVTLGFEAFRYNSNGILVPICPPVFSEPIRNMKSALTGELKICRIDRHFSTCVGGDEVWMLVEKVGKKNIKVKFYELDEDDNEIWYDFGKFTELDVHHQYAIVFRTPPYRQMDLDESKDVLVQLFRPTDGAYSESIKFTYRPSDKFLEGSRKRARPSIEDLPLPPCLTRLEDNFTFPPPVALVNTDPGPMLSSGAETQEILRDIESLSVSSATLDQMLYNDEGLDSAEFREFMQHESFEGYLSTFNQLPNDMDLTTDGGSSRRRPIAVARPPGSKPPCPPMTSGDLLLKTVVRRLIRMITTKPLPHASKMAAGLRDLFEKKSDDGDCALHEAVKPENKTYFDKIVTIIEQIRAIQSESLQLYISDIFNARNKKLETPLNRAVFYHQPGTVVALLKGGANPNLPDINGFTPIHLAVSNGDNICLSELLTTENYAFSITRPYLNIKSEDGFSPLHVAARGGNVDAVRLLVRAGADVNEKDMTNGKTALHIAVEEENADMARFLVSRPDIRVNEANFAGNTALHMACVVRGVGSLELCSILVGAKANPSLPNYNTTDNDEEETESQEDEAGPVVKLEPMVELDEMEEPHGQTSFDLASDNKEITELLQECVSPRKIKEEPCDVDESHQILLKEEPAARTEFFDRETLWKLCKILNETRGWEKLAQLLDYQSVLESFRFQSSPSRALFNYADIHGTTTVEQISEYLSILEETAAVKVIDEMLARRLADSLT